MITTRKSSDKEMYYDEASWPNDDQSYSDTSSASLQYSIQSQAEVHRFPDDNTHYWNNLPLEVVKMILSYIAYKERIFKIETGEKMSTGLIAFRLASRKMNQYVEETPSGQFARHVNNQEPCAFRKQLVECMSDHEFTLKQFCLVTAANGLLGVGSLSIAAGVGTGSCTAAAVSGTLGCFLGSIGGAGGMSIGFCFDMCLFENRRSVKKARSETGYMREPLTKPIFKL